MKLIRLLMIAVTYTVSFAITAGSPGTARAQRLADVELPLGIGLRMPEYDRVNGLSLPWGPNITFGENKLKIEPTVTYRSHLGNFDPSINISFTPNRAFELQAKGGRGTFTNEEWIRATPINSLWSLFAGNDARNYYRADRGYLQALSTIEQGSFRSTFGIGAGVENAWSTGWRLGETNEPFSLVDQKDTLNGFRRENPLIDRGRIPSGFVTHLATYEGITVRYESASRYEYAWESPTGDGFSQFTVTQSMSVRTISDHDLRLFGRLVTTTGGATPLQRYHYLGGSGSISTIDMLSRGGDRMLYLDAAYHIPLRMIDAKFLGNPYIAPRFATGSTGVREFGRPSQNVGARIGISGLWVEYARDLETNKNVISSGISLGR